MSSAAAIRVIKLGGSLLDWAELPQAFHQWLGAQSPLRDLLVAGGGGWADLIREADARFTLGEESSHRLCLRLMGITARLTAHVLRAELIDTWPDCVRERPVGSPAVVDLRPLVEHDELVGRSALPHTWDVTSDSLAAWLAGRLGASELVLLKSCLPGTSDLQAAARHGYIDAHFPRVAQGIQTIRCVHLRASGWPEFRW